MTTLNPTFCRNFLSNLEGICRLPKPPCLYKFKILKTPTGQVFPVGTAIICLVLPWNSAFLSVRIAAVFNAWCNTCNQSFQTKISGHLNCKMMTIRFALALPLVLTVWECNSCLSSLRKGLCFVPPPAPFTFSHDLEGILDFTQLLLPPLESYGIYI